MLLIGTFRIFLSNTNQNKQWRKSIKIIGGDETEPTKVALIKKRIVA